MPTWSVYHNKANYVNQHYVCFFKVESAGDAALDFQGIHLAVLTGENGAGKSSLLDAITWALWGKARAKRDDELIYLGQTEMEVEYTFGLGDNVYRLIRKRDATKRGRSDLGFQVEDAGGWRTLTEPNLRATQTKINQLLRLDYDTFINSAFLLQGRADEFTTKPPGQRKEILGDILGLQIYEVYEERSKKRANQQEKEATQIEAQIEQIEQELVKETAYQTELAGAQQQAAEFNRQLQLAEQEMELLREQHRAVNEKQRQLDDLRDRLLETEADIAEMAEIMAEVNHKINEYRTILERRAEIEAGQEKLRAARGAVKDWEQRLHESAKLSDRKHELDMAFNAARAEVEANLREVTARVDLLSPKVAAIDSQRSELLEVQARLEALQATEKAREVARTTLADLDTETARLEEQNKQLKYEMNEIKANLIQLEQAGSKCPVCQRPLDGAHQAEVLAQFQHEGKAKGDIYRANQTRFQEIVSQRKELEQQAADAEKQLRQLTTVQGRVAQLTQTLAEAETAVTDLKKAQAEQDALQQQLDTDAFATDVLVNLTEVEAELSALGYDRDAHQQARTEVEALLDFEEEGRILGDAEQRILDEEKRLEREIARQTRLLEQVDSQATIQAQRER